MSVGSLNGIEELLNLQDFGVDYIGDGDVSALLKLPGLKIVTLGEDMRQTAQSALAGAKFNINYVTR
ncbi:hypothetical protein SDC9_198430 [bioreactor metagenome]|uniref:Uncharacterized protein n=1 Tax=bioreactor metagenome TaxID=1076179 RepID=A0A645IHM3_9ZZZZ